MTTGEPPPHRWSLSLLFPAFDERQGIEHTLNEAIACGDRLVAGEGVERFEVIVVDDGSTDGTAEFLDAAGEQDPRVRVLHHRSNEGLGSALRTGFDAAMGDLVFYTDADLPIDLDEVATAIDLLERERADVVSAYRRRRYPEGVRRFVYSVAYNSLVRITCSVRVRDVNFAAKLFRRDVLDDLTLESRGSFIDAELLARAARRGALIAQFPADYQPRTHGVSRLSSPTVIRQILAEMISLSPQIRRERPRSRAT